MKRSWNGPHGPPRGRKWPRGQGPPARERPTAGLGASRPASDPAQFMQPYTEAEAEADCDPFIPLEPPSAAPPTSSSVGDGEVDECSKLHNQYSKARMSMVRAYRAAVRVRDLPWLQRFVGAMRVAALQMDAPRCAAIAAQRRPVDAERALDGCHEERVRMVSQLMWEENKTRSVLNKAHAAALGASDLAGLRRDLQFWEGLRAELDPDGKLCADFMESKTEPSLDEGIYPPRPKRTPKSERVKLQRWTPELLQSLEKDLQCAGSAMPSHWDEELLTRVEADLELLRAHVGQTESKRDFHAARLHANRKPPGSRSDRKVGAADRRLDRQETYLRVLEEKAALVRRAVKG